MLFPKKYRQSYLRFAFYSPNGGGFALSYYIHSMSILSLYFSSCGWFLLHIAPKQHEDPWHIFSLIIHCWQVTGVPVMFVSALEGRGRVAIMHQVVDTYQKWCSRLSTARLNRWLRKVKKPVWCCLVLSSFSLCCSYFLIYDKKYWRIGFYLVMLWCCVNSWWSNDSNWVNMMPQPSHEKIDPSKLMIFLGVLTVELFKKSPMNVICSLVVFSEQHFFCMHIYEAISSQ